MFDGILGMSADTVAVDAVGAEIEDNAKCTTPVDAYCLVSLEESGPVAKKPRLQSPLDDLLVAHESHCKIIRDAYNDYIEMNGGVIDDEARMAFKGMIMNSAKSLIAIEPTIGTKQLQQCEQAVGGMDTRGDAKDDGMGHETKKTKAKAISLVEVQAFEKERHDMRMEEMQRKAELFDKQKAADDERKARPCRRNGFGNILT